jgi:NADPH-dependent 2,4-dienoyl-CoA reductase/sulfur reductase-like enzyme
VGRYRDALARAEAENLGGRPSLPLDTIVVIGGSLAGIRSAEALRRKGFSGRLVFVGEENEQPYDRPPLSKELLRGDREPDQIRLTKPENFEKLELDLHLGVRAESVDPATRRVTLAGGTTLDYDGLVIATGTRSRSERRSRCRPAWWW